MRWRRLFVGLWGPDLFSIPGMSAECERVFSQTKKMITDERNRLAPEVVEADQLQKHWLLRELVV